MDSTLAGAKFSGCIGFAMAETAPVFARRRDLLPCSEKYALDLNQHALDLNSMAVFSSEAPLRFELYPFTQARSISAYAYAAANFWLQQPCISNTWTPQAVVPSLWASQTANCWNFDLPSRQEFAGNSLELREERGRIEDRALAKRKGDEIHEDEVAKLEQSPVNDEAPTCVKDTVAKPQQLFAKDEAGICSDTASKPNVKIVESPDWLPRGWITEVKTRKAGSTAGTKDKYYKDPVSGHRFRSRNEVLRFLQTGRSSRYRSKLPPPECSTNASGGASLGRPSNTVTACNVGPQHGVKVHTDSSTGLGAQLIYSPLVGPEVSQPDTFSKVVDFKTTSLALSVPSVPNRLLRIPDWLNKILPAGHSYMQDFLNCQNEVGPGGDQSSADVFQGPSTPEGSSTITKMKEHDGGDRNHRAKYNLVPENKDGSVNVESELDANLGGFDADLRPQRIHDAGIMIGTVGQRAKDWPTDEQFVLHQKDLPALDGMLGQENTTPAMQPLVKNTFNADQILQPTSAMPGQQAYGGMYQKNVTSPILEQPFRDMVNTGNILQATNGNTADGFGITQQTKGSWTNQMGVKRAQKMKPKRGKELLAVLGRKLCWQGLGLSVGILPRVKEQGGGVF